jgi:hypothetical protein
VRDAFAGHILQDRDQMIGLKYTLPIRHVVVKIVTLLTFFHIYFTAPISSAYTGVVGSSLSQADRLPLAFRYWGAS